MENKTQGVIFLFASVSFIGQVCSEIIILLYVLFTCTTQSTLWTDLQPSPLCGPTIPSHLTCQMLHASILQLTYCIKLFTIFFFIFCSCVQTCPLCGPTIPSQPICQLLYVSILQSTYYIKLFTFLMCTTKYKTN